MAWLNCHDKPPKDFYSSPCIYHGRVHVTRRISLFTYTPVAKNVPLAVLWDGTEEDLREKLWAFFEEHCQQKGLGAHCATPGGDGDYYGTIVLDRVEELKTEIPAVFRKLFKEKWNEN